MWGRFQLYFLLLIGYWMYLSGRFNFIIKGTVAWLLGSTLNSFARSPITNTTDRLALTVEIFFLPVLETGGLRPKCQQVLFLPRPLSLLSPWFEDGCHFAASSHHCPSCACVSLVSLCVLIASSCKDTCHIGLGPPLMTSSQLNYLLQGPVSHSKGLGVRTSVYKFWGNTVQLIKAPPHTHTHSQVNM